MSGAGFDLYCRHDKRKETQSQRDLTPPYPSATDGTDGDGARDPPVPHEGRPGSADQPTENCHRRACGFEPCSFGAEGYKIAGLVRVTLAAVFALSGYG